MSNSPIFVILVLAALWYFLFRTRATPLESTSHFDRILAGGQPVVVDFFSNT